MSHHPQPASKNHNNISPLKLKNKNHKQKICLWMRADLVDIFVYISNICQNILWISREIPYFVIFFIFLIFVESQKRFIYGTMAACDIVLSCTIPSIFVRLTTFSRTNCFTWVLLMKYQDFFNFHKLMWKADFV